MTTKKHDSDDEPDTTDKPEATGKHDTHSSHRGPSKPVEKTDHELREEEAQERKDEAKERGRPE